MWIRQVYETSVYAAPFDSEVTMAAVELGQVNEDIDLSQTHAAFNHDFSSQNISDQYLLPGETRVEDGKEELLLSSMEIDFDPEASQSGPNTQRISRRDRNRDHEFNIGQRIDGRFEVADVRWGGMGVVYLCYDHEQREPVAIKSFQGKFLNNSRAVARFEKEAATWIHLEKHQNIVQARLVQNINERPHIILEHISGAEGVGVDLRSWIDRNRLDIETALLFGLHIALAMQHATQKVPGLVHRDLKPGNILVTHDAIAKVTDFGLVRSLELNDIPTDFEPIVEEDSSTNAYRLTRFGAIVGTAPYMSPEQCKAIDVDMRSDIYSFGCVMYEMLTGKHIFQARGIQDWMQSHLNEKPRFDSQAEADIPDNLRYIVLSCLNKELDARPQNWGQLVNDLSAAYEEVIGSMPLLEISGPRLQARELMDKGYSLTELGRLVGGT